MRYTQAVLCLEILAHDNPFPKQYLPDNNKFWFASERVVGTYILGTTVEDPQGFCLICVKQNVSYFAELPQSKHHAHLPSPRRMDGYCRPQSSSTLSDPSTTVTAQALQCSPWQPVIHFEFAITIDDTWEKSYAHATERRVLPFTPPAAEN